MDQKNRLIAGLIAITVAMGAIHQAPVLACAQSTREAALDAQATSTATTTDPVQPQTAPASIPPQQHSYGWEKDETGSWRFYTKEGSAVSGWLKSPVSGIWYYLDPQKDNTMAVGPFKDATGTSYVANNEGACLANRWVYVQGKWYLTSPSCSVYTGWQYRKAWYFLDNDTGAMYTDVIANAGKFYLLNTSGAMVVGWGQDTQGSWHYAKASGELVKGWFKSPVSGLWYWLDPSKEGYPMYTSGIVTPSSSGPEYYLHPNGAMAYNAWVTIQDGIERYATASGALAPQRSIRDEKGFRYLLDSEGRHLYGWQQLGATRLWCDPNHGGRIAQGWVKEADGWYLFSSQGAALTGWQKQGALWYYLKSNGAMQTGWLQHNGHWYWLDPTSGAMKTGWLYESGHWYWLHNSGAMATGWHVINGYWRNFTYSGICTNANYQNPSYYYPINGQAVSPKSSTWPFSYVAPLGIGYNATRDECVEAFIATANLYIGTPYIWDYACAPGVGVDCAGLVLQCMYSVGMDPAGYSPYDHYYSWNHDHYVNDMRADPKILKVSTSDMRRGDLLFWPGHVAIYIGNGQVIEAASGYVTKGAPSIPLYKVTAVGRLFV